jgi:hypothetical protein
MGTLDPRHKPDFTHTEPPVDIPYTDAWSGKDSKSMKIVSMDPFGHIAPFVFKDTMNQEGVDIRPSIAVTKARIRLSEVDETVRKGQLNVDGKIVTWVNKEDHQEGVEIKVNKAAVEPVWWLPGKSFQTLCPWILINHRCGGKIWHVRLLFSCFGCQTLFSSESLLRRALFEDTGGMYPELITRPDIKVFLPPIGGLTVYLCTSKLLASMF